MATDEFVSVSYFIYPFFNSIQLYKKVNEELS